MCWCVLLFLLFSMFLMFFLFVVFVFFIVCLFFFVCRLVCRLFSYFMFFLFSAYVFCVFLVFVFFFFFFFSASHTSPLCFLPICLSSFIEVCFSLSYMLFSILFTCMNFLCVSCRFFCFLFNNSVFLFHVPLSWWNFCYFLFFLSTYGHCWIIVPPTLPFSSLLPPVA